MLLDQPIAWVATHGPAVVIAGVLVILLTCLAGYIAHRASGTVLAASIGALVCTGFSADTSWRFAGHRLHMETSERLWLFAAGDIVLIVCAVMARSNKLATATDDQAGTPGVPGVMVWCIAAVQVIPAFTESGLLGGIVRSVFGPVMAALLWHLAMGLEIRVARPEALSTGLPAQIGHELRERLLSYLGLATRNRTAEQISRDRATARTVRLASRAHLGPWGRAALKASVARSGAATDGTQRHHLLQELAARRNASALRTLAVTSPWVAPALPEPYPPTPQGVTGAELRRMDPLDAVLQVHASHPAATPAELAALCTGYGVTVTETQVGVALRALPKTATQPPIAGRTPAEQPGPGPADTALPITVEDTYPLPELQATGGIGGEVGGELAIVLPAQAHRPGSTRPAVHARVPDGPNVLEDSDTSAHPRPADERAAAPTRPATRPETGALPSGEPVPGPAGSPTPDGHAALLDRARAVDAEHRTANNGQAASVATLKARLHVGQPKAQLIRDLLAAESRSAR
ncbi:hypothetical protein AB0D33_01390 [Streptomyces sp. NPDC048404]|uniref:hypothetical protein n=1 Tax=unclassified Streptomyces TaxID=2593676 RepID=UPI003427DE47